jgi:hypothetical protein
MQRRIAVILLLLAATMAFAQDLPKDHWVEFGTTKGT